jgi:hypothetical protein
MRLEEVWSMVTRARTGWLQLIAVALVCAAPAASAAVAPPADHVVVTLRVTGAVQWHAADDHAADARHNCRPPLEVMPGPGPGAKFANLPFKLLFSDSADPSVEDFALTIDSVSPSPGPNRGSAFHLKLTVGGKSWEGDSTAEPTSLIETSANAASGRFRIGGLHSVGHAGTISVEGTWRCPAT